MEEAQAAGAAMATPTLWQLALVFCKVGGTGFGGAMPMLAMIQSEVVAKRHWVNQDLFGEAVLLGQVLPGPVAIDAAAYIGYRLRGWPGAIVGTVAFILPSFLLMLALTVLYLQYGQLPQLAGALKGLGSAVVALVAMAAYRMGKPAVKDKQSLVILLGAMAALLLQVNIVLIIALAGLVGIGLYRSQLAALPQDAGQAGKGARS